MYVYILWGRLPWDSGLARPDEIRSKGPDPSVIRATHEEESTERNVKVIKLS